MSPYVIQKSLEVFGFGPGLTLGWLASSQLDLEVGDRINWLGGAVLLGMLMELTSHLDNIFH